MKTKGFKGSDSRAYPMAQGMAYFIFRVKKKSLSWLWAKKEIYSKVKLQKTKKVFRTQIPNTLLVSITSPKVIEIHTNYHDIASVTFTGFYYRNRLKVNSIVSSR